MEKNPAYRFPFTRYPAIRIALFLSIGIILGSLVKPGIQWLLTAFAVISLYILRIENSVESIRAPDRTRGSTLLYLLLICLFGALLQHQRDHKDLPQRLMSQKLHVLAWESMEFRGQIEEAAFSASGMRNYRLMIKELKPTDGIVLKEPFDVRAYSHSEEHDDLQTGNIISGRITLYEFPERRNPHEFDYGDWLLKNRFSAQGRIDTVYHNDNGNGKSWQKLRNYALKNIDERVSIRAAPLTKALVLGYKNELSSETRRDFSRSGLAHIMAVSGMHVGFIIAPFWLMIPWFWQRRYGKAGGLLIITLVLFLYAGLTGFSASVCRASMMFWLFVYSRLYHKVKESINLAGVAVILLLLIDPHLLYDIGFQLSFGAVFTILLLIPKLQNKIPWKYRSGWRGTVSTTAILSVVVQMGLFPILVHYFGEVSVTGPLANILVLPLLPVTLPAGLAVAMAGTDVINEWIRYIVIPLEQLMMWVETVAGWFGSGSYSYLTIESVPISLFPLWVVLIGFMASLQISRVRWKLLITAAVLLNISAAELFVKKLEDGMLEVTYFDVGQGDAIHIKTPHGKHLLIDTGRWTPGGTSAERILLPYFESKGVDSIDAVVLTHPHADHIGGMPDLLDTMHIQSVYKSRLPYNSELFVRMKERINRMEIPVAYMQKGMLIELDPAIRIFVLGPESRGSPGGNPNNHSVALKVVYGSTSFMFTGDAEEIQERELAERYQDFLSSDVYKAGHHGSNTSSSERFINLVNPQITITSLAFRNRFGHPGKEALGRIHATGSEQLYTSLNGAVILQSNGKEIRHVTWK